MILEINVDMNTTYPWGKWKGIKVSDMLDPSKQYKFKHIKGDGLSYLEWARDECGNIHLLNDVLAKMEECRNKKDRKAYAIKKDVARRQPMRRASYQDAFKASFAMSDDMGYGPFPF